MSSTVIEADEIILSERQVDDLRNEFDWMVFHNKTKAASFDSWMRHRKYSKNSEYGYWFYK